MPVSEYHTLAQTSQAIFREKMSKFIAFASPASSADEAKAFIATIANEYHDARHVCWAYMLGADCAEFQSNDNGEPSGTAGKPILGQIRSAGITNTVIAVVRYFGGIKLGTSGLIAAYREAARLAIEAGEIITMHEQATIEVTFAYQAMNDVMRALKASEAKIAEQQFDNTCLIRISIRADHAEALSARLAAIDSTSVCLTLP